MYKNKRQSATYWLLKNHEFGPSIADVAIAVTGNEEERCKILYGLNDGIIDPKAFEWSSIDNLKLYFGHVICNIKESWLLQCSKWISYDYLEYSKVMPARTYRWGEWQF